MNTDSHYEIGASHAVCEDYALSGNLSEDVAYALVADGCSASPNTDIGARVISHCVREYLEQDYLKTRSTPPFDKIVLYADVMCRKMMGLNLNCCDTTLLYVIYDKKSKSGHILLYGDGGAAIQYEKKDGTKVLRFIRSEFTSGAPYYMTYGADQNREEAYRSTWGDNPRLITGIDLIEGKDSLRWMNDEFYHDHISFSQFYFDLSTTLSTRVPIPNAEIKTISVFSDGIESYLKANLDDNGRSEKVSSDEMVQRMCGFKNFNGEFVKRRMKRVQRDCDKEEMSHFDDISIASIYAL